MSSAFRWVSEVAEIRMTSPFKASTSEANSDSGSRIRMSSSVERARSTISSFAEKLFPEPLTPSRKELPFNSFLRSATSIFLLTAFCP